MGNVFRVINSNGDIEITMYRKANAVFKTNEYNETDNICTYKETINIFNLLKENQELKSQLKGTTHCFDEEEHRKLQENYDRIYAENCKLREEHNINDISLLDENYRLKKVIDEAIEYIKEMTANELNYINYKGKTICICGSDFNSGADIILDILNEVSE